MGIREVGFGMDEFNKPKVLPYIESIKQIVMNVLTCKPGNIPSMPTVGVNIRKYIEYVRPEDLDKMGLQNEIRSQLATVLPYDEIGEVMVIQTYLDGQPTILITIPIESADVENTANMLVSTGFSLNGSKDLLSSIEVQLAS